jgi:cyclophilin family peptidyl-prolyl cis-trans isomerase
LALACLSALPLAVRADQFVELDYNLTLNSRSRNSVFVDLFSDRPLTTANYLQYVDGGLYNGTLMHRLVRDQTSGQGVVLQGGGYYPAFEVGGSPYFEALDPSFSVDLDHDYTTPNPTVPNEFNNVPTRSNARGTLAMAKFPDSPDSATTQWFVNLANNGGTSPNGFDYANGGYTVFGQVVGDGMTYYDFIATPSSAQVRIDAINLNPDSNQNGIADDTGPFGTSTSYDGVPALVYHPPAPASPVLEAVVILENAKRVNYFGSGSITNVPAGGLSLSTQDAFIDTGATFSGTGAITVGTGRTLGVREDVTLSTKVINQGTLAPGSQLGKITLPSYQQTSTGTLAIQIRGTTADSLYDQLAVTGQTQLAGTLSVSLINSFNPVIGNSFQILSLNQANTTGVFANLQLGTIAGGPTWDTSKLYVNGTISVTGIIGDFNHNGRVDTGDYVVWRQELGSTGPGLLADANDDLVVDTTDYNIWKAAFGQVAPGAGLGSGLAIGVPEPASVVLLAVASATLLVWRVWGRCGR